MTVINSARNLFSTLSFSSCANRKIKDRKFLLDQALKKITETPITTEFIRTMIRPDPEKNVLFYELGRNVNTGFFKQAYTRGTIKALFACYIKNEEDESDEDGKEFEIFDINNRPNIKNFINWCSQKRLPQDLISFIENHENYLSGIEILTENEDTPKKIKFGNDNSGSFFYKGEYEYSFVKIGLNKFSFEHDIRQSEINRHKKQLAEKEAYLESQHCEEAEFYKKLSEDTLDDDIYYATPAKLQSLIDEENTESNLRKRLMKNILWTKFLTDDARKKYDPQDNLNGEEAYEEYKSTPSSRVSYYVDVEKNVLNFITQNKADLIKCIGNPEINVQSTSEEILQVIFRMSPPELNKASEGLEKIRKAKNISPGSQPFLDQDYFWNRFIKVNNSRPHSKELYYTKPNYRKDEYFCEDEACLNEFVATLTKRSLRDEVFHEYVADIKELLKAKKITRSILTAEPVRLMHRFTPFDRLKVIIFLKKYILEGHVIIRDAYNIESYSSKEKCYYISKLDKTAWKYIDDNKLSIQELTAEGLLNLINTKLGINLDKSYNVVKNEPGFNKLMPWTESIAN